MLAHRPAYREVEIKLRVVDLCGLIRVLGKLGARCSGRVLERNTLYDTPDADLRSRRRMLRVRIETPAPSHLIQGGQRSACLTAKRPVKASNLSRYKEKFEREVSVSSPGQWSTAVRSLGFGPGFRYEKFRTTFRLRNLRFDLDETPVGVFLELEGAPKAIDRVARTLGFSPRDYICSTYWDLYAADCSRRGRIPRNMLFIREKSAKNPLYA